MPQHTVLLVDDEPNVLSGLRRALRGEPYDVITAKSAFEALLVLKERQVDLVIADYSMPGLTGTDFLARVRKDYPDTVRFILTGHATLDIAISAINEGAVSHFFTKPCNDTDLIITIRQALQQKDLMLEARRLLQRVRQQSSLLQELERHSPGITQVLRDEHDTILLDDIPSDYEAFLDEVRRELP